MNRNKFLTAIISFLPISVIARFTNSDRSKGFKVSSGQARLGKRFVMKGVTPNTLDLKISSNDTEGSIAIFEQTSTTAKSGPPLHIHLNQDEIFYILEGKYLFQVGDEKFELERGDTIFLPRIVPHAFMLKSEKGKVHVTFQPAGKMEDFFAKSDQWSSSTTKDEIKKVFEECEMKVVGPPLRS